MRPVVSLTKVPTYQMRLAVKTVFTLVFIHVISVTVSLHAQSRSLTEVDLTVNGIRNGTKLSQIYRRIGKPRRVHVIGYDNCATGFRRVLIYPGVRIGVISDLRGRDSSVISIEVTSSRWKIAPGLKIGAGKAEVRKTFGPPTGSYQPPGRVLDYVTKDDLGLVNFHFRGNKLVKITMIEALC